MAKINLDPCRKCIIALRNKLNSCYGNITYHDIQINAKNNVLYAIDPYTGLTYKNPGKNNPNTNLEHIMPSQMACGVDDRDNSDRCPGRHDGQNIFRTNIFVNSLRKNSVFGTIEERIKNNGECIIINGKNIYIPLSSLCERDSDVDSSQKIDEFDNTIYSDIEKFNILKKDTSLNTYITTTYNENNLKLCCSIEANTSMNGQCVIEPSDMYKGFFARIIFYYYLMYAFGWNDKRIDTNQDMSNMSEWEFYERNMSLYYDWATNPKYNTMMKHEHTRNKKLIKFGGVPNIFVGYISNSTHKYVKQTPEKLKELLDALLYNASHHNQHKKIILKIVGKCCEDNDDSRQQRYMEYKIDKKTQQSRQLNPNPSANVYMQQSAGQYNFCAKITQSKQSHYNKEYIKEYKKNKRNYLLLNNQYSCNYENQLQ